MLIVLWIFVTVVQFVCVGLLVSRGWMDFTFFPIPILQLHNAAVNFQLLIISYDICSP